MSKRKSSGNQSGNPTSLELDEEQIAALQEIPENLHPSLKCLVPTRQATDFKRTTAAAKALGVDYKEDDISYIFNLKNDHLQDFEQLFKNFASVIHGLKSTDYVSATCDDSFCRTVLDLIIIDRLRHLKDRHAHDRLQISAEVPVSIRIKDTYGNNEIVKGRADWAMGYGTDKSDTGAILLILEAKPYDSPAVGLPQLLVCMAAVHEARKNRANNSVFGMVSDSKEFRFSFLDEKKKLFTSRPFAWVIERKTIIAYIDMMLINAIESSPHTNQAIRQYPEFLGRRWEFEDESNDRGAEEEEESDMVDVVNIGGRVLLRSRRQK